MIISTRLPAARASHVPTQEAAGVDGLLPKAETPWGAWLVIGDVLPWYCTYLAWKRPWFQSPALLEKRTEIDVSLHFYFILF